MLFLPWVFVLFIQISAAVTDDGTEDASLDSKQCIIENKQPKLNKQQFDIEDISKCEEKCAKRKNCLVYQMFKNQCFLTIVDPIKKKGFIYGINNCIIPGLPSVTATECTIQFGITSIKRIKNVNVKRTSKCAKKCSKKHDCLMWLHKTKSRKCLIYVLSIKSAKTSSFGIHYCNLNKTTNIPSTTSTKGTSSTTTSNSPTTSNASTATTPTTITSTTKTMTTTTMSKSSTSTATSRNTTKTYATSISTTSITTAKTTGTTSTTTAYTNSTTTTTTKSATITTTSSTSKQTTTITNIPTSTTTIGFTTTNITTAATITTMTNTATSTSTIVTTKSTTTTTALTSSTGISSTTNTKSSTTKSTATMVNTKTTNTIAPNSTARITSTATVSTFPTNTATNSATSETTTIKTIGNTSTTTSIANSPNTTTTITIHSTTTKLATIMPTSTTTKITTTITKIPTTTTISLPMTNTTTADATTTISSTFNTTSLTTSYNATMVSTKSTTTTTITFSTTSTTTTSITTTTTTGKAVSKSPTTSATSSAPSRTTTNTSTPRINLTTSSTIMIGTTSLTTAKANLTTTATFITVNTTKMTTATLIPTATKSTTISKSPITSETSSAKSTTSATSSSTTTTTVTTSTTTTTTTTITTTTETKLCGNGWTIDPATGSCYKVLTVKAEWYVARNNCDGQGAELSSIRSSQELEFIKGLLSNTSTETVWLGGNNLHTNGSWFWTDESPIIFTDWDNGYPNNSDVDKHCLLANIGNYWKWNNEICNNTSHYGLCKISGKLDGYTKDSVTGSLYKIMTERRTWSDAKSYCESDDAELASICNFYESEFIKGLLSNTSTGTVWLGGNDLLTNGSWFWTDGSPITFNAWEHGYPNYSTGNQHCLSANIRNGWKWNNVLCNDTRPYSLCKVPGPTCPCKLDGGKLTCDGTNISNFPEDLIKNGCYEVNDYSSAWRLVLKNQPLRVLSKDAFSNFSSLTQISMSFNQLEMIQTDAFKGMNKVRIIFLKSNKLHTIQEGALNDLANLEYLDIRNNQNFSMNTTNTTVSSCPCVINDGELTCQQNTISNFPDDLTENECDEELDYSSVWRLVIRNQPFKVLNTDAFKRFPSLSQIVMTYNSLRIINTGAFRGLDKVRVLILRYNQLEILEEGSLDELINLKHLDLRENSNFSSYTTNSWYFCEIYSGFRQVLDSPSIYKNFKSSNYTNQYCNSLKDIPKDGCDRNDSGIINCTFVDNISPCNILKEDFSTILFNFPEDKKYKNIDNYYEGESNNFFQEFNSEKGSMKHAKYMLELNLYETKYDLAKLKELTSSITETVTIKADTVFMSSPITISHYLNIQARIVALDYPITMKMSKEILTQNPDVDAWAKKEEYYYVGKVLMNKKSYGLVTILQNSPEISKVDSNNVCGPKIAKVEETGMDVSSWFDVTNINLLYVCAMTVMKTKKNSKLVDDMSKFMLNFVYDSTTVGKQSTFIAAQKFSRILDLNKVSYVHNVPAYSVETVSTLARILYDRMIAYQQNEINQEIQLAGATNMAQTIQASFDIIKIQQQQYFDTEMTVLESIWTSSDNVWKFSFDHRNTIENKISSSLDTIQDQITAIQTQSLKQALQEAEMSKQHIEDVITSYQKQITRLTELVQSSAHVQSTLMERLSNNTNNLQEEFNEFDKAVKKWKEHQEAKKFMALIKISIALGNFMASSGKAIASKDPLGMVGIIGNYIDLFELLEELSNIVQSIRGIQELMDELDLNNLAEINLNLGTSFKDSLQTMVQLKMKGSDFDEMDRTATIKLDAMNQATNFEIDGTDDLMMAMTKVTDVGKQLITEAADFSELVLKLSEESDKLEVAKLDKERTTLQISNIKTQLSELETFQMQFIAEREKSKKEYENEIEKLKSSYVSITKEQREVFRNKIMKLFQYFQDQFYLLSKRNVRNIFNVQSSIHQKFYGLKEHSMTQRALIMSLYIDYCDAKYFNSFKVCDENSMPYMSDDLDSLLDTLIKIQWESVVSDAEIPGKPIQFGGKFVIDSNNTMLYGGVRNYYVDTLKSTYHVDINLKDLDIYNRFDAFWRIRIDTITILLLDANSNPIKSAGTSFGEEIQIKIQYPLLFNDTDHQKNSISFLAHNSACNSDYVTTSTGPVWSSECKVDLAFNQKSYKPAPNGVFSFKIENPETIDIDSLDIIQIDFTGTRIGLKRNSPNLLVTNLADETGL